MKTILKSILIIFLLVAFIGCNKDDDQALTLTASVNNTSNSTGNFNGDVTGNGGSTTESFTWNNAEATADYNMDITSSARCSFRFQMKDVNGVTVLDRTLVGETAPDSYSGVTNVGTPGNWMVTITLTNFDGNGSYSASSGD